MFVGSEFCGDENKVLMDVQHAIYGRTVGNLYGVPRLTYLRAAALLDVENELVARLRTKYTFDHRTLQDAHDHIAAFFRFSNDDGGQLRLGESVADYRNRLQIDWQEFVEAEVGRLIEDNDFVRDVCTAAAFGNEDLGYAAEDRLRVFLQSRYGDRGLVFTSRTL